MPADLSLSYLGLTLDDRDPQQLFDASLERFQALNPQARLRNGSIETMLLESMSVASADVIYALNRLPATVVEAILALHRVPRFTGSKATGVVTVTFDGTRSVSVDAGQQFRDPASGLIMETTEPANVVGTTIVLPVTASDSGSEFNEIITGTMLDVLDSIPYAVSAELTTGMAGGSGAEPDADYFDRASARFARVTSSLVIPSHFVAFAIEDGRASRVTAVDLFEPGGTIGADIGNLTVYVYGRGAALSASDRDDLRDQMQAISSASTTIHVEDAEIVVQNMALTVKGLPGHDSSSIQAAVEVLLRNTFDPATWPWGRDILTNQIIDTAAGAVGVDYVVSVATPATNVSVDSSQLVRAGTVTVVVT